MPRAAARVGDTVSHDAPHCHAPHQMSGPIPHPPVPIMLIAGCPTVTIGGVPAVRATDRTAPCIPPGCQPGAGGVVLRGSSTVNIGGLPAARVLDPVSFPGCVGAIPGPTGAIRGPGASTVNIGG